jgi:predicted transcriptional regulator
MREHKIQFPQEIDVWYILPALRKKIALGLLKEGMNQKEVAFVMKTSEATISHYKKDKRVKVDVLGTKLDVEIKDALVKIEENHSLLFSEIVKLSNVVKEKGIFCELYDQKATVEESIRPCNECHSAPIKLCLKE